MSFSVKQYLVSAVVSVIVGCALTAFSMGAGWKSFPNWPETVGIFVVVAFAAVYSVTFVKESYFRDPWSFNEWQREREFNVLSGDSAYITSGALDRNAVSGLAEQ